VKRKMIFGSIHVTIFHLETSCFFCTYWMQSIRAKLG
jgi:hypothetical protein